MKKLTAILMALLLVLSFAACATTTPEATTEPAAEAATEAPVAEEPAVKEDITLTLWGSELPEFQAALRVMADNFIAEYADEANITIDLGAQSESTAKDTILLDIPDEIGDFGHDLLGRRCLADHRSADAGQRLDEGRDVSTRVHQALVAVDDPAPAHQDGGDLGGALAVRRRQARGLEVDDGDGVQRQVPRVSDRTARSELICVNSIARHSSESSPKPIRVRYSRITGAVWLVWETDQHADRQDRNADRSSPTRDQGRLAAGGCA